MTNATIPDTIERTAKLPQPVERVWAALTDPAEFGRWFCQEAAWELREGALMTMRWDHYGTAPGLIVAVVGIGLTVGVGVKVAVPVGLGV